MWNDPKQAKMYKSGKRKSLRLISFSWNCSPGFIAVVFISVSIVNSGITANGEEVTSNLSPRVSAEFPVGLPENGKGGGSGDVDVKNYLGSYCDDMKIENGKNTIACKVYTTIPTDIRNPHDIQVLDMREKNTIQVLTNGSLERSNLKSLTSLMLKNCQIRTIERGAFDGGKMIITLDISSNSIEVLDPEVFAGLSYLTFLIMSNNPIHRLKPDAVFPVLPILKTIALDSCSLNEIASDERIFKNLSSLQKLHLQKNKLKTLDWRIFRPIKSLLFVNLAENQWHCDCHVKFLMEFLRERGLATSFQHATCTTYDSSKSTSAGGKWEITPTEEMVCKPTIDKLIYTNLDVQHANSVEIKTEDDDNHDDDKDKVKKGQNVYFDCEYSGHPKPKITWLKDNRPIMTQKNSRVIEPTRVFSGQDNNGTDSSTVAPPPQKPKQEVEDLTHVLAKTLDEDEQRNNYKFKEHLIVRRVEVNDSGLYSCIARNDFGAFVEKFVRLNVTGSPGDLALGGAILPGGKKVAVWMWILIALLCILILILMVLLTCLIWKRREKRKQEGFRKVVHDKFKDSNIDLGEFDIKTSTPNSHQSKNIHRVDGATPLLDNRSESSTILINDHPQQQGAPPLPDVALGNAELIHNAQIFSPKPPPALHGYPGEARKEFFARQISEPYLRPASAMSLSRPAAVDAAQRRYIFANQQYQSEPQENLYAVPVQIRDIPRSGSAMSFSALPDDLRRQMFLKQYPQSQYATTARPPRRIPSTGSEPPPEIIPASYNYSTLPRRPVRLQNWSRPVSPSNSTCSTYSTLSWRPNLDPRTGVMSDGLGARNSAHGGSTTSVNKIPDMSGVIIGDGSGRGNDSINRAMLTPSDGSKPKSARTPRFSHSRTPSSLTRGANDFFSFEPIQEVESSECASTHHLDRAGGRQTPTGYTTQSLARGEPRYKKKKPPSITMIPANLKAPSGAFDHLKGRSVSPALRNSVVTDPPKEEIKPITAIDNSRNFTGTPNSQRNLVKNSTNDANNGSIPVPMLESPIDDKVQKAINSSAKTAAAPPPPPPPKPKRSQNQSEEDIYERVDRSRDDPKPEIVGKDSATVSDGTVV